VPHEPEEAKKTKLKNRLADGILPAAQTAVESPSVRQRDLISRKKSTCRQR